MTLSTPLHLTRNLIDEVTTISNPESRLELFKDIDLPVY